MIGLLTGKIIEAGTDYLILDVSGVGYKVETEAPHRLGLDSQEVTIRIYTHVREKEIRLFGFPSVKELMLFEKLLDVSGVGPKSAMAIVSTYSVGQIINAISTNEPNNIKVKGVGKKTLAKVVIELNGKLDDIRLLLDGSDVDSNDSQVNITGISLNDELVSAMQVLGYTESDIETIASEIDYESSISEQIKQALRLLN